MDAAPLATAEPIGCGGGLPQGSLGLDARPVLGLAGEALSTPWVLRDGTTLTLRALRNDDRRRLGNFFDGLSAQSRYQRFFLGAPSISEEWLDFLIYDHAESRLAFVVIGPDGATIVAEGRIVIGPPDQAELAITVSDAWQGRGIGRRLLRLLITLAGASGVGNVRAEFLSENRRMLGLLRDAHFAFGRQPGDGAVGRAYLRLDTRREAIGHLTADPTSDCCVTITAG